MTGPNIISVVVCFTLVFLHSVASAKYEDTYIVRVSPPAAINGFSEDNYESYFQSFVSDSGSDEAERSRIVYSYRHVASGFAAKLSPEMVSEMRKKKGFISARPQKVYHTYTTHSPNFLGLHQNFGLWQNSSYGKGVIVGVLDTGITPNHPSFNDENMPPPPEKWKGTCAFEGGACNNKLIGARNFVSEVSPPPPPVDEEGHGTHTASTAAGNFVANVSVIGSAKGTAVGMAPLAHLSIYKVCTEDGCAESAILAAMDAAIEDGVDVLSLSLGGASESFFEDSIAVGAFAAMEKGIFVSCAAGNDGPDYSTLSNEAPWILTVGASTIDRTIKATAVLGNGEQLSGESAFQVHNFPPTLLPLVYPGAKDEDAALCGAGSLDKSDVKGKVVLCDRGGGIARVDKGKTVKEAGGAAMILVNQEIDGYTILADTHVLPATELSYNDGLIVKGYINSTTTTNSPPTATIVFKGTIIGTKTAPSVASFSSRGPNSASPGILKPDILGPGVNILAAWPFSVDNNTSNNGNATFNIISGTSMATPHLSGIAALLKSAHPDWSPAAIKSAIITTADQYNLNGSRILDERLVPADVFATGGGHVNPSRASDPGLIYDLNPDDYIPYLCGLNYTDQEIQQIVQRKVECSQVTSIPEAQLNYPSFAIWLGQTSLTYSRTVTNVGEANSMYTVKVSPIPGVDVGVMPDTLVFTEVNQKLSYNISFSPSSTPVDEDMVQGAIAWVSQNHIVKSPIALIFQ